MFGWLAANLACEAFGLLHSERYLRIRYEDIVRAPAVALPSVFKCLTLQPLRLDLLGASDNRHQLHGNKVRREPLLLATLKEDIAWKTEMPKLFRWLTVAVTIPFFVKYGYLKSRTLEAKWPKKA
jgi:hypothetical protein